MNATAVAEQTVLLMLGLRGVVSGDAAVRQGRQMEVKLGHIANADLKEIADCRIGFIGFGDIARATAKICYAMGAELVYNKRTPLRPEAEAECHAVWLSREELLATCDIVSLHTPVTPQISHMVNREFLAGMKKAPI